MIFVVFTQFEPFSTKHTGNVVADITLEAY